MINFTPSQNKTIAAGITAVAAAAIIAAVLTVGWVLLKFLALTASAITPVLMGMMLALFFKPYYEWCVKKVCNPTLALTLMILSVLLPLSIALWQGGALIVDQISHLMATAPTVIGRTSEWANTQFPDLQIKLSQMGVAPEQLYFLTDPSRFSAELIESITGKYGGAAMKAGLSVLGYLSSLVNILVTIIFMVYFILKPNVRGEDCVRQMPFLKDETKSFVAEQINVFLDIVVSFFQRQTVICLIEGVLYGVGFMLVGLPYGFILGFALGVLNLVPLFGTVVCLPLALPIAYFGDGGSLLRLIGVLCVWGAGQVLDGYLITPKIQGEKTGLGYAGVIFSFFFWGVVFHSLLGLLLAIPLSAFCVVFWRVLKQRYIKGII